jgi:2-amino-4-hydroxy-6-hydroxymethyldihydropteridine diphosphokinase
VTEARTFIRAYIGLGSNLDDPLQQLQRAIAALRRIPESRLTAVSPLYRSKPMGPANQPDYLNAVAMFDTCLEPLALLDALQTIEQQQGRVRTGEHWGPRTLDLDLLLYGSEVIDLPRLQVPHPEITRRGFVLCPLSDLAPELTFPDGLSLRDAMAGINFSDLEPFSPEEDDPFPA